MHRLGRATTSWASAICEMHLRNGVLLTCTQLRGECVGCSLFLCHMSMYCSRKNGYMQHDGRRTDSLASTHSPARSNPHISKARPASEGAWAGARAPRRHAGGCRWTTTRMTLAKTDDRARSLSFNFETAARYTHAHTRARTHTYIYIYTMGRRRHRRPPGAGLYVAAGRSGASAPGAGGGCGVSRSIRPLGRRRACRAPPRTVPERLLPWKHVDAEHVEFTASVPTPAAAIVVPLCAVRTWYMYGYNRQP